MQERDSYSIENGRDIEENNEVEQKSFCCRLLFKGNGKVFI